MKLDPSETKDLLTLRRLMRGFLATVDRVVSQMDPVCIRCFQDHGLVAECTCGGKR